ncbi:MAG: LexA family transcriptional regulator [Phycisphaeraceae bacterium]
MDTVGQIIRHRREGLGLTLTAVAQAVGTTKSYLSMIENHRTARPPSRQVLEALERALGIGGGELTRAADWQNTPDPVRQQYEQVADAARRGRELAAWLRDSTRPRPDGAKSLDTLFQTGELSRRITATLGPTAVDPARVGEWCDAIDDLTNQVFDNLGKVPVRFRVPLINKVAAGYPTGFTDLDYPARVADRYVTCPDLADPQAFAAVVVGQSMLPEYREGDVVVFSPDAEVTDGCDCFVRLEPDHETTFKRVFFDEEDEGLIRLQPLNRVFPPRTVDREQVAGLYRAVWRLQKLD